MLEESLPIAFSRQDAIRSGFTRHMVTTRVRQSRWKALRRGAFCRSEVFEAASAEQRHLLTALAALATPSGRAETLSHISAAVAYGWPTPLDFADDPWFTISQERHPTRRRSGVVRQVATLPDSHLRTTHGVLMTNPERTVADCLRHYPADVSVPIADAAARNGADLAEIGRILAWQERWPYYARGLASSLLVDPRRESWLESRSAVAFHRWTWPMPSSQVNILDARGHLVGRVDFLWAENAVIGEADGWDKYRIDPAEGRRLTVADDAMSPMAFRAEKEREDRLRDLGFAVVRWTTADVLHPERGLNERLSRAFARADPRSVLGRQELTFPAPAGRPVAEGLIALSRMAGGRLLHFDR